MQFIALLNSVVHINRFSPLGCKFCLCSSNTDPPLIVLLRTLGTPNNDVWPDVESLPDYKNTFPKWKSGNLSSMVKNLDKNGLDLLAVRTRAQAINITHNITSILL